MVTSSGRSCGICKPTEQCAGCELPRTATISKLNSDDHAIAVDWEVKDIPNVFSEERMNVQFHYQSLLISFRDIL